MRVAKPAGSFLAALFLVACTTVCPTPRTFDTLYVADYGTDDPTVCQAGDVHLEHEEAREFFRRAQKVEHRILHDYYEHMPCYVEGPVNLSGKSCTWKIRGGATGSIQCGSEVTYYACDICKDLLGVGSNPF